MPADQAADHHTPITGDRPNPGAAVTREGPGEGENLRPQADFCAPISLGAPERAVGTQEPDLARGRISALIAAADPAAEIRPGGPKPPPLLTRRISQGRPTYAEPDPKIAGVVGRVAPTEGGEGSA